MYIDVLHKHVRDIMCIFVMYVLYDACYPIHGIIGLAIIGE